MAYSKAKSILWISAISILVAGIIHLWLPGTAKEFYLNAFDKFYVISNMQLTAFLCFICVMVGSGYYMLSNQGFQSPKIITATHVIGTVACATICWFAGYMLNKNVFSEIQLFSNIFGISLILLLVFQLLYFGTLLRLLIK